MFRFKKGVVLTLVVAILMQCMVVTAFADSTAPSRPVQNTGLIGEYYKGTTLGALKFTRTDKNINFNWLIGAPKYTMLPDKFSVRWQGQVVPMYSETYTFYIQTDDGVRLWVNNKLIIDSWKNGNKSNSGTIDLKAGLQYEIKMEYYENYGLAKAKLLWSSNSQAKEIIPSECLVPVIGDRQMPIEPTNLVGVAVTDTSVKLSWTASADNYGVKGYWVYRYFGNNCKLVSVPGTSYFDTGLEWGVTYKYRVEAYDSAGNRSDQSNEIIIKLGTQGKLYYNDGTLKYEGDLVNGQPEGKGTLYYETGKVHYFGEFKNGLPDGYGKAYYEDGSLMYEGEMREGNPYKGKGYLGGVLVHDGYWILVNGQATPYKGPEPTTTPAPTPMYTPTCPPPTATPMPTPTCPPPSGSGSSSGGGGGGAIGSSSSSSSGSYYSTPTTCPSTSGGSSSSSSSGGYYATPMPTPTCDPTATPMPTVYSTGGGSSTVTSEAIYTAFVGMKSKLAATEDYQLAMFAPGNADVTKLANVIQVTVSGSDPLVNDVDKGSFIRYTKQNDGRISIKSYGNMLYTDNTGFQNVNATVDPENILKLNDLIKITNSVYDIDMGYVITLTEGDRYYKLDPSAMVYSMSKNQDTGKYDILSAQKDMSYIEDLKDNFKGDAVAIYVIDGYIMGVMYVEK